VDAEAAWYRERLFELVGGWSSAAAFVEPQLLSDGSYFDGVEGAWRTRWADAPSRRDDEDGGAAEEAAHRRCPTLSSLAGKRRVALI